MPTAARQAASAPLSPSSFMGRPEGVRRAQIPHRRRPRRRRRRGERCVGRRQPRPPTPGMAFAEVEGSLLVPENFAPIFFLFPEVASSLMAAPTPHSTRRDIILHHLSRPSVVVAFSSPSPAYKSSNFLMGFHHPSPHWLQTKFNKESQLLSLSSLLLSPLVPPSKT